MFCLDMGERTNFENLQIYQLAERLADRLWQIVLKWSPLAQDTVGKQMIRSADSIGANIAEGSGRGSDKDFLRFLKIGRGSLYETRHWLRRAYKRDLLLAAESTELSAILNELAPKLNAYMTAVKRPKSSEGPNQNAKDLRPKPEDQ